VNQADFTSIFCARPQNFAWFLGAGTSRVAGLPTATDILWDLKRRHYCREENQELTRQDLQNPAVRDRIQSFMDSHGFPPSGAPDEYAGTCERIFGDDKERQRRYLRSALSEDRVTLSVGSRVLGALLASGLSRVAFTTNFDSVVERAVAELGGASLSAYHLEGSHNAVQALNNEEFPFYCKLHGDFRYDSLKNLPADLAAQNAALAASLVAAGSRFGFVVAGYSGRDDSIMELFRRVLTSPNPFPHGLFWLGMKGSALLTSVSGLLDEACAVGVNAAVVEIETFDALMLRLWRNIESKPARMDAKVRRTRMAAVSIPVPDPGTRSPVIRLNALPVLALPRQCLSLSFQRPTDFSEARHIRDASRARLILGRSETVWCWGADDEIRKTFGANLAASIPIDLPADFSLPDTQSLRGFVEEALCRALARGKPLVTRSTRTGSFLIANVGDSGKEALAPLNAAAQGVAGVISGLMTAPTDQHPKSEQVGWAEALRISLDQHNGRMWLLLEPDIWIWPPRARPDATGFLERRRGGRFNAKHNALLDAWIRIILGTDNRDAEVAVLAFDGDADAGNPCFRLAARSGFSKRTAS
jgi:hypothetical protein